MHARIMTRNNYHYLLNYRYHDPVQIIMFLGAFLIYCLCVHYCFIQHSCSTVFYLVILYLPLRLKRCRPRYCIV